MTAANPVLIIAACAACTFFERLLPFLVFGGKKVPRAIEYLGKVLPTAVIAALVIFCVRDIDFSYSGGFLPQLIAIAVTAGLHWWKGNTLLSVFVGTGVYMLLVQFVFGEKSIFLLLDQLVLAVKSVSILLVRFVF